MLVFKLINSGGAITERDNGEQGRIYEIASKQAGGDEYMA